MLLRIKVICLGSQVDQVKDWQALFHQFAKSLLHDFSWFGLCEFFLTFQTLIAFFIVLQLRPFDILKGEERVLIS